MSSDPASTVDLDGLNLAQALRDFEVANARVLDLTRRLVESELARLEAVDTVELLRIQVAETASELEELKSSKAYRLAQQVGVLRARLAR
jgi:hypothetical protein